MAGDFISGVASDLAANLISGLAEAVGGPSIERIRDFLFQKRVMARVVRKLCTGYEELELAERAEGELLAIDERFFRDPEVRLAFIERAVEGEVDRKRLRDRYVALYGEEQVELFEGNLDSALAILEEELSSALHPAIRAQFAEVKRQLDQGLKQSTEAILARQARTEQAAVEYGEKILERIPNRPGAIAIEAELLGEYQAQLDHARRLLQAFQPKEAREYLYSLKARIWGKASSEDKSRLLTYAGLAHLQLNEEPVAAQMFIDAWDFNRSSAKALCNAALGFLLQGDRERCKDLARQALEKDPTVERGYSMLVYSSGDDPLESILAQVPEVYRNTVEVAMAIGRLAWQRGLLPEAERWFRVAVGADTQDHPEPRGMLADLLLTRLVSKDSALPMPGLVNPKAGLAGEAVQLYDFAWDRVARTEIRSLKLDWLINRATARMFLSDIEGAIQDTDEALRDQPQNPYLIKNRALLAYRARDLPKAAALLRPALDAEDVPEAVLLLSVVLAEDGRLGEADSLVQQLLERADLPGTVRRDAAYVQVSMKLQADDLSRARSTADSLMREFPDDAGVLALCSRVARYEGRREDAESLLADAQAKLMPDASMATRYRVVDELYANRKFEAATDILEEIVDTEVDSEPTRQLLACYYGSGDLGPALEICRSLREKYGPLRFVTEMESAIWEEIGDLAAARQVCLEHLGAFPDDVWVRLRLAAVQFRTREFEALDGFLDQDIDTAELSFEGCDQLARLYLARGRMRRAIELAYETRRRFFNSPDAHLMYVHIFLRRGSELDDWLDVQQASIGAAVRIDRTIGNIQPWIIIEDRDDADAQRGEFASSHPLVQQLLNKQVGDSVTLSYGAWGEEITVVEVRSKFVHACNESLEAYQALFPDVPGIWRGRVQVSADGTVSDEALQPILDMLDRRYEFIDEAEQLYRRGNLTIGSLAQILGKNPIEVHARLMAEPDPGVRCCSGRVADRQEAVALVGSSNKLIADITSLMTLQMLDIGNAVVGACGRLGVVRSSLELVETLLSDQSIHEGEYWTLGKEGDQYVRTLVTEELVEYRRRTLEGVLAWAEANCEVLPCSAALTVRREAREKLGELIGPSFLETILVAADEDRILYSEDRLLRELARAEYGVRGLWTQAVLMVLEERGAIPEDVYVQSVVRLACANYRHTCINKDALLEATKQAQWRPTYPFSAVARMLDGSNSDTEWAARVAAKYVRLLWGQKPQPHQYEWLIHAVLDAITSKRSDRRDALSRFLREIQRSFPLAPLEVRRIRQIVHAWAVTHML